MTTHNVAPILNLDLLRARADDAERRLAKAAPDMLTALQLASNVLFLLSDEVTSLGNRAENVPEVVRAALARASSGEGG